VVATRGRDILLVPVIYDREHIHRSDVVIPPDSGSMFSARWAVFRCSQFFRTRARHCSRVGTLNPAVLRDVMQAIMRERDARQIEELPPGIVRSNLAGGCRIGNRGRKVGGAPSD